MKKILFFISIIIYSINCLGQQIVIDNLVTIKLPNKLMKTSKAAQKGKLETKFKRNHLAGDAFKFASEENMFEIDDLAFNFQAKSKHLEDNYLAEFKRLNDSYFSRYSGYYSTIKQINNRPTIITRLLYENVITYSFITYTETTAFSGKVVLNKVDDDKAKAILDEILKSAKFNK